MEHKNLFTSFLIFILNILRFIGSCFKFLFDLISTGLGFLTKKIESKNDLYLVQKCKKSVKPSKIDGIKINGMSKEDFFNPAVNR